MFKPYDHSVVQDCRRRLAEMGCIITPWSIEDVQALDSSLTDEQAWLVLRRVEDDFSADIGIDWTVISVNIDYMRVEGELEGETYMCHFPRCPIYGQHKPADFWPEDEHCPECGGSDVY